MRSSSSATLFFADAIFSAVVINKKGVLHEISLAKDFNTPIDRDWETKK